MASCRACGGELWPIALCPTCEENVRWKCLSCSKGTDASVHTHGGRIVPARIADLPAEEPASAAAAVQTFVNKNQR
ncbi:MAG: hypothetical protein AB1351_06015 [Thermoproteota archaeon]